MPTGRVGSFQGTTERIESVKSADGELLELAFNKPFQIAMAGALFSDLDHHTATLPPEVCPLFSLVSFL